MHSHQIQHRDKTQQGWGSLSHIVNIARPICVSALSCPHVLCISLKDVVSSCGVEQTAAITKVSRSQIYLLQLDHMGPHRNWMGNTAFGTCMPSLRVKRLSISVKLLQFYSV